ncbi:RHS repeat domain-containing protein [Leminorella grimontii]|uniref:RHS repeat domain-containing protein n=1 Tax=Leminorella grimontii TaxID=82981 RepID=UPI0021004FA4|nr:RHS repeat-associated core domain-containing protein [Leminorella grimontii]
MESKVYWYHNDHLGTPHCLTNINGEGVYRCQFDAYGNLVEEETSTYWQTGERLISFCNPLRFQGQYEDEESGLFYNLNRYYQPELGRYITPDPIGLMGGYNPYAYVHNPNNWIDPLGLATCPPVGNDGYKFSFGSLRHILRRHSPHVGPPKQEPYASMKPKRQKRFAIPIGVEQ